MSTFRTIAIMMTAAILFSCSNSGTTGNTEGESKGGEVSSTAATSPSEGKVEYLTKSDFLAKVFNYEKFKEWKYQGDKPAVIDFYADWCRPCKLVAPIMDELASEYKGKVHIYKVNTDKEKELAGAFQISSIPAVLFIPVNGQPQMAVGALPKEEYVKAINNLLTPQNQQ
ncbi:MAG TPA: thioredoxin [Bacteroidales bacterium]|nr:thioredoxin [Bacteroidales bacterium]HSA44100.1 thioredoxin [Bacteroidales bacterium]